MRWIVAVLIVFATNAQASEVTRESICSDLSREFIEKRQKGRDHRLYRVFEFYSSKIDA